VIGSGDRPLIMAMKKLPISSSCGTGTATASVEVVIG
jgi:hypothetical protein